MKRYECVPTRGFDNDYTGFPAIDRVAAVQAQTFGTGLAGKFIVNVAVNGDIRLVNADRNPTAVNSDWRGFIKTVDKWNDCMIAGVFRTKPPLAHSSR